MRCLYPGVVSGSGQAQRSCSVLFIVLLGNLTKHESLYFPHYRTVRRQGSFCNDSCVYFLPAVCLQPGRAEVIISLTAASVAV